VIEFGDSITYQRLINTGMPVVSYPLRILSETVTFMSRYQIVRWYLTVLFGKLCAALGEDKATLCGTAISLSYALEASAR